MGIAPEALEFSYPISGAAECLPTPEDVRGLPLSDLTEQYGTVGLRVRLQDSLERYGLADQPGVTEAVELGLLLHADDQRTNGHAHDHLMRVTLRILDHYQVRDANLTIAAMLHDSVEDHSRELVRLLSGQQEWIEDIAESRERALQLLSARFGQEPAEIIRGVTNPVLLPGQDKRQEYLRHTHHLTRYGSPKARLLKLSDFVDNAVGNHYTRGPKRERNDRKYLGAYTLHIIGLSLPDALLQGELRERAVAQLVGGEFRTLDRLMEPEVGLVTSGTP